MGETWCVELSSIFCKNFLLNLRPVFGKIKLVTYSTYQPTQVQSFESIFVEAYQLFWMFSEPRGHGAVLFASRILLASCHNPTKSWAIVEHRGEMDVCHILYRMVLGPRLEKNLVESLQTFHKEISANLTISIG